MNRKLKDAIDGFFLSIVFIVLVALSIMKYTHPTEIYYAPDERPGFTLGQ